MAARPEHVKTTVRFWEFWDTMAAVRVEHPGLKYSDREMAGKVCLPWLDTIKRKTMIVVSTIRTMIKKESTLPQPPERGAAKGPAGPR